MHKRIICALMALVMMTSILPNVSFAVADPYPDVAKTHWAYSAIIACNESGFLDGYPDGTFKPENPITRAEAIKVFAKFMNKAAGKPAIVKFKDVASDAWFAPYIGATESIFPASWLATGNLSPDEELTREETVFMIIKAMGYDSEAEIANPYLIINAYSDNADISEAMKPYFSLATSKGIITGCSDGTAKPSGEVTRAELSAILCRALEVPEKHRLRDEFVKENGICETNAIGVADALLLQSTGDYFMLEVDVEEAGYHTLSVDYSHDSYEITTRVMITYEDGETVTSNCGLLSGKQKLSLPIYLKKGVNKVRFQHALRQLPHYILPLYIYGAECKENEEALEYTISPKNAKLFLDNLKTPLATIKNWKSEFLKVTTESGEELPFKAEPLGKTAYTEAMLKIYLDEGAVSKLSEGKHILKYHLEDGKVLSQELEIIKETPESELEFINFSVDKANSTLMRLPNGKYLLIDSGYDSTAEERIIPFLRKHNIKLDYYILTHFHKDHWGKKDDILEMNGIRKPDEKKVEELITKSPEARYAYLKDFGYIDSSMVCYYDELDKIWDLGGAKVLITNSRYTEDGKKGEVYNKPYYRIDEHNYENATSISFMLDYKGFRYFHAADNYAFCLERYMSDMIKAKRSDELSCDWYFGNHHFQYDISPEFIKTLNPVAVFVPNNDGAYHRATYRQHYKNEVENFMFFGKRLADTLVSHEVGSARVCVNSGDDWYYETVSDDDMYE